MNGTTPIMPSDNLAALRKFIASCGSLGDALGTAYQVRLVVDTNVILGDLRWLVTKRTNPAARTVLQELIASETVIAFAPRCLRNEVEKYLPEVAADLEIPEDRLLQEWRRYQTMLHFYETEAAEVASGEAIRDPKDLPFLYVYVAVGASAIYSRDKDLPAMGAPAVTLDILLTLREYARATSVEITIKVGGVTLLFVGIGIVSIFMSSLTALGTGLLKLPKGVQWLILIAAALALTQRRSRMAIADGARLLSSTLAEHLTGLIPILQDFAQRLSSAQECAVSSWRHIESVLRPSKKQPVRVLAFAVCLAAKGPLSVSEIDAGIREAGYCSRSRRFRQYLVRVLRRDRRLREQPGGFWTV